MSRHIDFHHWALTARVQFAKTTMSFPHLPEFGRRSVPSSPALCSSYLVKEETKRLYMNYLHIKTLIGTRQTQIMPSVPGLHTIFRPYLFKTRDASFPGCTFFLFVVSFYPKKKTKGYLVFRHNAKLCKHTRKRRALKRPNLFRRTFLPSSQSHGETCELGAMRLFVSRHAAKDIKMAE